MAFGDILLEAKIKLRSNRRLLKQNLNTGYTINEISTILFLNKNSEESDSEKIIRKRKKSRSIFSFVLIIVLFSTQILLLAT